MSTKNERIQALEDKVAELEELVAAHEKAPAAPVVPYIVPYYVPPPVPHYPHWQVPSYPWYAPAIWCSTGSTTTATSITC